MKRGLKGNLGYAKEFLLVFYLLLGLPSTGQATTFYMTSYYAIEFQSKPQPLLSVYLMYLLNISLTFFKNQKGLSYLMLLKGKEHYHTRITNNLIAKCTHASFVLSLFSQGTFVILLKET